MPISAFLNIVIILTEWDVDEEQRKYAVTF